MPVLVGPGWHSGHRVGGRDCCRIPDHGRLLACKQLRTTQQLALVSGGYATSSSPELGARDLNLGKPWPVGAMCDLGGTADARDGAIGETTCHHRLRSSSKNPNGYRCHSAPGVPFPE